MDLGCSTAVTKPSKTLSTREPRQSRSNIEQVGQEKSAFKSEDLVAEYINGRIQSINAELKFSVDIAANFIERGCM